MTISFITNSADETVSLGEKIDVCVPTGNFGNIFACYVAREMGLPIGRLICASNKNNILTDFIRDGVYDKNRVFINEDIHATAKGYEYLAELNMRKGGGNK